MTTKAPYGVLLIHGFSAKITCISNLIEPLESLGIPVKVPILTGHGQTSPKSLQDVRWQDWVNDVQAALQELLTEVNQVIVVGHSMGGLLALYLAAECPANIDSLVLAAAAVDIKTPLAPGHWLSWLAPLYAKVVRRKALPPIYADPTLDEIDIKYDWVPTKAIITLFTFARLVRTRLPEVKVPTLIMQSRNDTTVPPKSAEVIYQSIKTAAEQKQIVWFDQTEHEMFCDCEKASTIAAVVDFVSDRMALRETARSQTVSN